MSVRIVQADAREALRELPENSVHCCVTSPPYFGLRDYGTATWENGDAECDHRGAPMRTKAQINANCGTGQDGKNAEANEFYREICGKCGARRVDRQIGLERTPDDYVDALTEIFREVRRVLKDDGTLWLNLGDSYAGSMKGIGADGKAYAGKKQQTNKGAVGISSTLPPSAKDYNLKPKDLIGIPWRVAFALQADGWYLRQDIIWSKPNPMPESVTDRCTKAHEYIFLLSKSERYHYDNDAIAELITDSTVLRVLQQDTESQTGSPRANGGAKTNGNMKAVLRKQFDKEMGGGGTSFAGHSGYRKADGTLLTNGRRNKRSVWEVATVGFAQAHFATFPPKLIEPCIKSGCPPGGTVLDPFGGAGTTGLVAERLGRNALLIELNPEYAAMAERRIHEDAPLFTEILPEAPQENPDQAKLI
ncbi:MAG: site-specific DNA-methyltransferase [Alphaproteobacteria bacterium]|nr:site-specific DNA-methyltransferase [Alphaproteobacteria bacterium]